MVFRHAFFPTYPMFMVRTFQVSDVQASYLKKCPPTFRLISIYVHHPINYPIRWLFGMQICATFRNLLSKKRKGHGGSWSVDGFLVLWFCSFMVLGFMFLWFSGFIVLWLSAFVVLWHSGLWLYGFLQFYGFVNCFVVYGFVAYWATNLRNLHFVFSGRY